MMKGKNVSRQPYLLVALLFSYFLNFAIKTYINIELNQDSYIFKFKLLALNSLSKENIQTILVSEFIVLRNI